MPRSPNAFMIIGRALGMGGRLLQPFQKSRLGLGRKSGGVGARVTRPHAGSPLAKSMKRHGMLKRGKTTFPSMGKGRTGYRVALTSSPGRPHTTKYTHLNVPGSSSSPSGRGPNYVKLGGKKWSTGSAKRAKVSRSMKRSGGGLPQAKRRSVSLKKGSMRRSSGGRVISHFRMSSKGKRFSVKQHFRKRR